MAKTSTSKGTARLKTPSGTHKPRPAEAKVIKAGDPGHPGKYDPAAPPGSKPRNY